MSFFVTVFLSDKAQTQPSSVQREITSYSDLNGACLGFVTGYHSQGVSSKLIPAIGHVQGKCTGRNPLIVGVTHENDHNNHNGSANFDKNIAAYVGDFNYATDFGHWFDAHIDDTFPHQLMLRLDTQKNDINVTGWPLQFGHLFLGVSDLTVGSPLDRSIIVEFDVAVSTQPTVHADDGSFNGRRIILGALGIWPEVSPRTNTSHFLEVDISQTPGYSESFHQPKYPRCADVPYDRCFYGDGRFAEGREVSYQTVLGGQSISDNTGGSIHVQIHLSDLFKRLGWVSPPENWKAAELKAIYFGLESTGATSTQVSIRNYHVLANSFP
jgi:hypothetical protein